MVTQPHGILAYSRCWLLAPFHETGQRCQSDPQAEISPLSSSSRSQEGAHRLHRTLPVVEESDFCLTKQQANISLHYYGIYYPILWDINLKTKPPMLPEEPEIFLEDKAVQF